MIWRRSRNWPGLSTLPADRDMIHTINQRYSVDDHEPVINPEGMVGAKLSLGYPGLPRGAQYACMTARIARSSGSRWRSRIRSSAGWPLRSGGAELPSRSAAGRWCLTSGLARPIMSPMRASVIACGGSLAVGGDHVTNDIMLAFNIPRSRAEKVKKEHGRALIPDRWWSRSRLSLACGVGVSRCNVVNLRSLHVGDQCADGGDAAQDPAATRGGRCAVAPGGRGILDRGRCAT
jgi:hypothetical protein